MKDRTIAVHETAEGLVGVFHRRLDNGRTVETYTPPIPRDTVMAVWMRSPSVSGGKDWICCKTPRGVVTVWGKIWKAKQTSVPRNVAYYELVAVKAMKGYVQVAHFEDRSWEFIEPLVVPDHNDRGSGHSAPPVGKSLLEWTISDWVTAERSDWF